MPSTTKLWLLLCCLADATSVAIAEAAPQHAISLTDKALAHLQKLQMEAGSDSLLLRVGVKQGGCSGMSYVMDFEKAENVKVGASSTGTSQ